MSRSATSWCIGVGVLALSGPLLAADLGLGLRLEPPSGWQAQEERGSVESYEAVRFLSPPRPDRPYTAYLAIHRHPIDRQSLDEVATALLATLPDGARVEARETLVLGGLPAVGLTVAYAIPSFQLERSTPAIPVVTRWMLVDRATQRYAFVCSAQADDAPGILSQCTRALATVRWR